MGEKKSNQKSVQANYKTWGFVGFFVLAFIVVVAIIIGFNQSEKIDSSYFHDSDNKIVLTMDHEMSALDDSEYEPFITHVVYYHDGANITGVRAFYEYANKDEAKEAYDNLVLGEYAESKSLNGRFVVFQVKKSQFEDLTLEELKQNVELLKNIEALILDYNETTIEEYGPWHTDDTISEEDEENPEDVETIEVVEDEEASEDDE